MIYIIYLFSALLVLSGLAFFFAAAVGVVRFPDFYTRMHAAGKGDTLSTILILSGIALFTLGNPAVPGFIDSIHQAFANGNWDAAHQFLGNFFIVLKILAIALFIMFTSPTSTHALMQAGYDDGIEPFEKTTSGDDEQP